MAQTLRRIVNSPSSMVHGSWLCSCLPTVGSVGEFLLHQPCPDRLTRFQNLESNPPPASRSPWSCAGCSEAQRVQSWRTCRQSLASITMQRCLAVRSRPRLFFSYTSLGTRASDFKVQTQRCRLQFGWPAGPSPGLDPARGDRRR
jgi:hypothetical protein